MSNKWEDKIGLINPLGTRPKHVRRAGLRKLTAAKGWKAAFQNRQTGKIVVCPATHDISMLPGFDGPEFDPSFLDIWADGFVDPRGKFYTREQATLAIGLEDSIQLPHNYDNTYAEM